MHLVRLRIELGLWAEIGLWLMLWLLLCVGAGSGSESVVGSGLRSA